MAVATVQLKVETDGAGNIVRIVKDLEEVGKKAQTASEKLKAMASKDVSGALEDFGGKAGKLGEYLGALGPMGIAAGAGMGVLVGGLAAAGAAGAGLISWLGGATKQLMEMSGHLSDLAAKTGVSTDALQTLGFAGSLVGVSMEDIATGVSKMQKAITDGDKSFAALGLSVEKLRGMKPEDQFIAIAEKIAAIQDPAQRTAAAMDVFGKSGAQLLPLITSDLGAAAEKARELGIVLGGETVAAADKLGDSVDIASQAWTAFGNQAAAALVETGLLQDGVDSVTKIIGELTTYVKDNKAGFLELGTAIKEVPGILQGIAGAAQALYGVDLGLWAKALGDGFLKVIPGMSQLLQIFSELQKRFDAAKAAAKEAAVNKADLQAGITGLGPVKMDFLDTSYTPTGMTKPAKYVSDKDRQEQEAAAKKAAEAEVKYGKFAEAELKKSREAVSKTVKAQFDMDVAAAQERYEAEARLANDGRTAAKASHDAMFKEYDDAQKAQTAAVAEGANTVRIAFMQRVIAAKEELVYKKADLFEQLKINDALYKNGDISKSVYEANRSGLQDQINQMTGVVGKTRDWASALMSIAGLMHSISGAFKQGSWGASIAGAAGSFAQMGATLANVKKTGGWKKMDTGQKIQQVAATGDAALDIYNMARQERSAGKRTGQGAAKGAAAGAAYGPYGAAIGAVAGAAIAYFSGPKWANVAKIAGKMFGKEVSNELAEAIYKDQKKFNLTGEQASALHLADAMKEMGNNTAASHDNVAVLVKMATSGGELAAKSIKQLGEAFTMVKDKAMEAGKIGDAQLKDMITQARVAGADVPEIAAFVKEQLENATAGLQAAVTGIKVTTPEDMRAQAEIASLTFWAVFQEEGLLAASDAFAPIMEKLQESLKSLGGDAAAEAILGPIQSLVDLGGNDAFRGAADGAQGLADVLEGLANSAIPITTQQFGAFGQQAQAAFEQMKQAALDSGMGMEQANQTALLGVAPLLKNITETADSYGLSIDKGTQALLDQAKAAGVAFPTDPIMRAADAMEKLAEAIGKAFGFTVGLGGAMAGLPAPSTGAGGGYGPGTGSGPGAGSFQGPSFAAGGFGDFGSGTMAMLHGEEFIVPKAQMAGLMAPKTGGGWGGSGNSTQIQVTVAPVITFTGIGTTAEIEKTVAEAVQNGTGEILAAIEDKYPQLQAGAQ